VGRERDRGWWWPRRYAASRLAAKGVGLHQVESVVQRTVAKQLEEHTVTSVSLRNLNEEVVASAVAAVARLYGHCWCSVMTSDYTIEDARTINLE
jgi:hypothetical protein